MKSFAAVSALLLSAVSAAPVGERQTTITEYDITNFSANTTPHGTGAYLSYDIEIPGVLTTTCSYSDQSSVGKLPDITPYRPCDDASVEWQFRQEPSSDGNGQYLLVITYGDATGKKVGGSKEWRAEEFPIEQDGASYSQAYRGETDFVISNVA